MSSRAAGAVLLAALVCACPKKQAPRQDPNVIAVINGEIITKSEFERELRRDVRFTGGSEALSGGQLEIIKSTLLTTLIERTLLLQIARQQGVAVTTEELDRRVLRDSSDYPAEGFTEALAEGELTLPELRQKIAATILIEKLFEQEVYPRVAVTEDDLRHYFEEHKADFQEPEQVHAAQIVVKDLDDARRIQQQLRQGKRFADLAKKFSVSPDAKVGATSAFFSAA